MVKPPLHTTALGLFLSLCIGAYGVPAVAAQEKPADEPPGLSLELNTVEATEAGCQLTFVMRNGMTQPIEALAFELALFDTGGAVSGLIALDAGALPEGKTRVKRFNLPDVPCGNIARVLLNDVTKCEGGGLSRADCASRLSVSSRSEPEFLL